MNCDKIFEVCSCFRQIFEKTVGRPLKNKFYFVEFWIKFDWVGRFWVGRKPETTLFCAWPYVIFSWGHTIFLQIYIFDHKSWIFWVSEWYDSWRLPQNHGFSVGFEWKYRDGNPDSIFSLKKHDFEVVRNCIAL